MANTRETLGDQVTVNSLITHTLTSIEESKVTSLKKYALAGQSQITSVKFPNVTAVGDYALSGCSGLTSIGASDFSKLETIGDYAFADCVGLESADFNKVTEIGENAFNGCTSFTDIIIRSNEMATLDDTNAFTGTKIESFQGVVYVPSGLLLDYKEDTNWKNYFITTIDQYPCSVSSIINSAWLEVIENDNYDNDYAIGKTLPIIIGSYGVHMMELIAKDTDVRSDGDTTVNNGKARMTWMCKDIITTHNMNSTATNANGWPNTSMRTWLRSDILPLLIPVKDYIVPVSKTYYDNTSSSTKTIEDTIWIPSFRELGASTNMEGSGVVYSSRFNSNSARIKKLNNTANSYWSRTATNNYNSRFRFIGSTGGLLNSEDAKTNYGVVPCFCL